MKSNSTKLALVILLGTLMSTPINAALIDNGDGTITDDDLGIMWLQSPGPDANFPDATSWADSLVFAGYDNWRLPSALDFDSGLPDLMFNSTNNEFGHLYGDELGNPANAADTLPLEYVPLWYWTITEDGDDSAYAFFWSWDGLWLNDSFPRGTVLNATAVRDIGDVGLIPLPAAVWLFGSALIGLVGFSKRRKAT